MENGSGQRKNPVLQSGEKRNSQLFKTFSYLAFLLFAAIFSYYFIHLLFSFNHECKLCRISYLLDGTAAKPFQYRMLIPTLANWLVKLQIPFFGLSTTFGVVKFLNFLSLFFLALLFSKFLSEFFSSKRVAYLLSFSLFYIIPFNYLFPRELPLWYPWDMTAILIFTLGYFFLYQKNWPLFYLTFIIGTFNKETTCFLTLIYLYTAIGNSKIKTIILHCCVQFILWVGIKYLLQIVYADAPGGGLFENHVRANLLYLTNFNHILLLLSTFGFIWIPVFLFHFTIKDAFVQRSLFVAVIYFLGMFFVGNIYELRIFGELIPIFVLSLLLIIKNNFN